MSMAITGKDSLILDTHIFSDMADGDTSVIDFPNNLAEAKAGKNGNVIIAQNAGGRMATLVLRVIRGSGDDKWLNSRLQEYINDAAAFITLGGELIKRSGDGAGAVASDVYIMSGGTFQKIPGTKENVEGDTEQAVSIYTIIFGLAKRAIG
jgi:hypothetical protein